MISLSLRQAATVLNAELSPQTAADATFQGASTDTRRLPPGCLYVALRGERFDGHDFIAQAQAAGAAALLVDNTVDSPLPSLRVADTRLALGALAAHWRAQFAIPLLAVTGSNGKTTVKEMLRSICAEAGPVLATQGNLNNDIGLPLTLFELDAEHRHAVIEMGANHPGEIDYLSRLARPDVALITQCAPAHLAGFHSIDGVAAAKGEIFRHLSSRGTAVINQDDAYADFWRADLHPAQSQLSFGFSSQADLRALDLQTDSGGQHFRLHSPEGEILIHLPLLGRHNVQNALAAAACALAGGLNLNQIQTGLSQVKPAPGRLQLKTGTRGLRLIDDTYNANPSSLRAAMQVLSEQQGQRYLVLGDMFELGEDSERFHHEAGRQARALGLNGLYALGENSRAAVEAFGEQAHHCSSQEELITRLQAEIPAQACLLMKGSRGMRMEQVLAALQEAALES